MRAIGIVGYKDNGKTTLARALAQEVGRRGHHVAVVKHSSEGMDFLGKDTAKLGEFADQVGFMSPQESGIFLKGARTLEELLSHLTADLVIIGGFKGARTFPKIVCLSGSRRMKTFSTAWPSARRASLLKGASSTSPS